METTCFEPVLLSTGKRNLLAPVSPVSPAFYAVESVKLSLVDVLSWWFDFTWLYLFRSTLSRLAGQNTLTALSQIIPLLEALATL